MEEEEDINTKQAYLRKEILDEGYDPQEFNNYICNVKNEEIIDLNYWTLKELTDVVKSFKEFIKNKEEREQENNKNEIQENNENIYSINEQEKEITENPNTISKTSTQQSIQSLNIQNNDPFDYYERKVKCEKLEKNYITSRDDLFIIVNEPQRVNPGFFAFTYYQYVIKTYPLNYEVVRKVSDFTFLSQKLPLIDPVAYIPELPTFSFGVKDDSPEKIRFFQNYMNLLIENKYLRALPIVYDFISLRQEDWNNKVKNVYSKIKEPLSFSSIPNLEGRHIFKIKKEDEIKANNIKNDIYAKNDIYKNLIQNFDDFLLSLEKISINLKNISLNFNQLQIKYKDNNILNKGYENLFNVFQTWSKDYITQRNLIKEEVKYFFLFINRELNTFLKNYENYRMARDDYKNLFDTTKKKK